MEYHVWLEEFVRLANRGVDRSVLREHAASLDEWSDWYWREGIKRGNRTSQVAWADEHFPDIGGLRERVAFLRSRLGL